MHLSIFRGPFRETFQGLIYHERLWIFLEGIHPKERQISGTWLFEWTIWVIENMLYSASSFPAGAEKSCHLELLPPLSTHSFFLGALILHSKPWAEPYASGLSFPSLSCPFPSTSLAVPALCHVPLRLWLDRSDRRH